MRLVAAYLLLTLGGNASPKASDVEKLLATVGVDADASSLATLIAELEGKDVNALIAEGNSKLASVPSGGASAGASTSASAGAVAEEKKEEKVEEKEESDDDMGFGLFD